MGLSFKLARTGTRYRPRAPPPELSSDSASSTAAAEAPDCPGGVDGGAGLGFKRNDGKVGLLGLADGLADCSVSSVNDERKSDKLEPAPSFSLNLFLDGFSIGKPTEGMLLPLVKDIPKLLHPYDNASKSLFSAIEHGWLPGEIFDDLPCKYLNGTIVCEIWDYRSFLSKLGHGDLSIDEFPKVQKVRLQMGMETVVKDMASISDDSWTYKDLLQAESRIIKALRPVLYLAPEPSLDRLCQAPVSKQLDLGIYHRILKRKRHAGPEPVLDHTDQSRQKLIPSNALLKNVRPRMSDNSKGGAEASSTQFTAGSIPSLEQNTFGKERLAAASPSTLPLSNNSATADSLFSSDNVTLSSSIIPASDQVLDGSFTGLKDSRHFITGKSSKHDIIPSCVEPIFVTPKQEALDIDFGQTNLGQKAKTLEPHLQGKITKLHQEQGTHDGPHVIRPHHCSYSQPEAKEAVSGKQLFLGAPIPSPLYNQNAQSNDVVKLAETRNLSEKEALKAKNEHALAIISDKPYPKLLLPSVKSPVSHVHWIKTGASKEKPPKKETASRKRKPSQVPQISAGGSLDGQTSQHGGKQKNSLHVSARFPDAPTVDLSKSKATSMLLASSENAAMNSFSNSLTRETRDPPCTMKISKPINRNPPISMSDSGSQGTIGDGNLPSSSKSISVGTPSLQSLAGANINRAILERFSRIEKLVQRHGLDNKKSKPDNFVLTRSLPRTYLSQLCLVVAEEIEKFIPLTDKVCMSKCLINGSRNVCKTRILSYRRLRILYRGNGNPFFLDDPWSKLLLSEHDGDGTVAAAIIYGDDEHIVHLPLLPTPDYADLFAAQFTSLMAREGYELVDDRFQAGLNETTSAPSSELLHNCFQEFPDHPCTSQIPNQSMMMASFASDNMATLNLHGYPSQSLLSPIMPLHCLNLTRPQQLEVPSHVSKSIYMPQPLSDRTLPVQNSRGPICQQIPDSSQLQLIHLQQQFQQQQYQKQLMMQQNLMANHQSMAADFGSRHTLGLNDQRISGFCNSNQQVLNSNIPLIQATVLARINRSQVSGLMDHAAISGPLAGTCGIAGNSLLVSPVLSRNSSNPDQFQAKGSLTSCSNDSAVVWQHQVQQPKLHQIAQLQQGQHHLAMPQLNGSVQATRMSRSAPLRSQPFCSGPATVQVNTAISNIGSPQLSAQTVGSGGSITSSPQCISKASAGRNASIDRG